MKRTQRLSTLVLLLGLLLLAAGCGYVLLGDIGAVWVSGVGLAAWIAASRMPEDLALRVLGARPVPYGYYPVVDRLLGAAASRAGLPDAPALFLIPTAAPNAMAVGGGDRRTGVAVTEGLLRTLDERELFGVLAHETAHIAHGDATLNMAARLLAHLIFFANRLMLLVLLIFLPFLVFTAPESYLLPLAFVSAAPLLAALMVGVLSRSREYEADRAAAEITGDPEGLAQALFRIERETEGQRRMTNVGARPSHWLSSHPPTRERIRRLLQMSPALERDEFAERGRRSPAGRGAERPALRGEARTDRESGPFRRWVARL